jgi:hypothetical protein
VLLPIGLRENGAKCNQPQWEAKSECAPRVRKPQSINKHGTNIVFTYMRENAHCFMK